MTTRAKRLFLASLMAVYHLELGGASALLAQTKAPAQDPTSAVTISAGDVVAITVFPVEEYSKEVTVQPDGMIELPLIGAILVKGLTAKELQRLLESKYVRFVANPKVTVNIRRFSGRRVAILGEVHTAGYFEYRDGMKILELVSLAGGLGDNAKGSKTRILRSETGGGVMSVDLNAVLQGNSDQNVALSPGDTIYVPKGRNTKSVMWMTANILPWLSLMTLISSMVLIAKTQ